MEDWRRWEEIISNQNPYAVQNTPNTSPPPRPTPLFFALLCWFSNRFRQRREFADAWRRAVAPSVAIHASIQRSASRNRHFKAVRDVTSISPQLLFVFFVNSGRLGVYTLPWRRTGHPSVSSRVGCKLPLPVYADVTCSIWMTHHNPKVRTCNVSSRWNHSLQRCQRTYLRYYESS